MTAQEPILFFQHDPAPEKRLPALPAGLEGRSWRPRPVPVSPGYDVGLRWIAWWAMHNARLFQNRDFALQLVVSPDGKVAHRACVFPPFVRFPFMAPPDLQVGAVWTHPRWRSQGLATWSVMSLAGRHSQRRVVWYLTEEENAGSVRLARNAGFRLVARGERVPRDRTTGFAQYRIREWC